MRALPRLDVGRLLGEARRFAEGNLRIAAALRDPQVSGDDPWVERLLDGVGYLAGVSLDQIDRLQAGVFQSVTDAVAPELARPTPAFCLVQAIADAPRVVEANTELESDPVDGVRCRFRVLDGLHVGTVRIAHAHQTLVSGVGSLELTLRAPAGQTLVDALAGPLTLHVTTDTRDGLTLLHWLGHRCDRVEIQVGARSEVLGRIRRPGLEGVDAALPAPDGPRPVFAPLRLYAVAPARFSFVQVDDPRPVLRALGADDAAVLRFVFRTPPPLVQLPDVHLDRVLAANLFEASSEPLTMDAARCEAALRVAGSPARASGVYAVTRVRAAARGLDRVVEVAPTRRQEAVQTDPVHPLRYQLVNRPVPSEVGNDVRVWLQVAAEAPYVVRAELLAHDGAAASAVPAGGLRGAGLRSVARPTPYVPAAHGPALARSTLRQAALSTGTHDVRARVVEHLLTASVPRDVSPERHDAFLARVRAITRASLGPAKRRHGAGVIFGVELRLEVDAEPFLGLGDLGLFGACLFASSTTTVATNEFFRLNLVAPRADFVESWETP